MSRITLPGKLEDETVKVPFNFLSLLAVGETVSSGSVTATVYSGSDSAPEDIIDGSASVSSPTVTQFITGGTLGVTYLLVCTAVTSASQHLELSAFLAVVPDNQ